MLFVVCLLSITVFFLVASNVARLIDDFFAASHAFAFSFFVETFLVTACVLGRVRQTIHYSALGCFLLHKQQSTS